MFEKKKKRPKWFSGKQDMSRDPEMGGLKSFWVVVPVLLALSKFSFLFALS
jgi:hypothetical protein